MPVCGYAVDPFFSTTLWLLFSAHLKLSVRYNAMTVTVRTSHNLGGDTRVECARAPESQRLVTLLTLRYSLRIALFVCTRSTSTTLVVLAHK
jgi:hypothetical protein